MTTWRHHCRRPEGTPGGTSTRGGDFYLATSGDLALATSGDFLMATDSPHASLLAVVRALAGNEAAKEIAALLDEGAQR